MSSILTNNSAQAALQTLKSINSGMSETQSQISTGKRVANAKDNAAIWAISKTMEADVEGFTRISDSLSLGQASLSVARQASETVTDLLTEIKGKVIAAQESNVDRDKIQVDVAALREQIDGIVAAASFNGLNLLQNTDQTAGSGTTSVLSSLDRSSTGVTSSDIDVRKRDLGTGAASISASGGTFAANAATGTLNATQTQTIDASGLAVEAGAAFSLSIFGTDANDSSFTQADYRTSAAAGETQTEMAASDLSYVARDGDTMTDVVEALGNKWTSYAEANDIDSSVLSLSFDGGSITATSTVTDATDTIAVSVNTLGADASNTIGGALQDLADMDVSTESGASDALVKIEALLDTAISASASFGSDERRLETQADFVSGMSDALKSGIGTLVDADMEEASARLQALQTQQQLAIQGLSIANRAPQQLLSLFR